MPLTHRLALVRVNAEFISLPMFKTNGQSLYAIKPFGGAYVCTTSREKWTFIEGTEAVCDTADLRAFLYDQMKAAHQ